MTRTQALLLALTPLLVLGCDRGGSGTPTLRTAVLADAIAGDFYASALLEVSGGTAPYTFALEAAPAEVGTWLRLDRDVGQLSGHAPHQDADLSFAIRVADAGGRSSARAYTLHVMTRHESALEPLAVDGRQLVGRTSRRPVALRGVAFTSGVWEYDPDHPEAWSLDAVQAMQGRDDFARVKGWGASAVTLYLNWYWFRTEEGWNWLGRTLDWCREQNLYVIPSLLVYPVGGKRGGPAFWADPQAMDEVEAFWRELERRHRDDPVIAGVDVLNEPQGTDPWPISRYELRLVDAVREESPDRVVFIEPRWGNPVDQLPLDRAGLVYVAHYYEPQAFTAQGWPWMWGGGVPVGVHYPGLMPAGLRELGRTTIGHAPSGTSGWRQVTGQARVEELGGELPTHAHLAIHAFGNPSGTAWFDALEYSLDGGATWRPAPNGSFETVNEVSPADPALWEPWSEEPGHVRRVSDQARDGRWSLRLQRCADWCDAKTGYDGSYDFLGGIPVEVGQTLRVRFWARSDSLGAEGAAVEVVWMEGTASYWDRDALQASVQELIVSFSERYQAPVFVGELSPSLIGPRPDVQNYVSDLLGILDEQGVGWVFYPYRENWTDRRYLGLYNAARDTPTSGCVEDTEVVDAVRARF